MFGLFKKKSEEEVLLKKYNQLIKEAYNLSHSNRTASDAKTKEANDILDKIDLIKKNKST
tara:strand:- start:3494 stop:3673 length:180 start_codon:yes stop_codon:yes gene_type:complete